MIATASARLIAALSGGLIALAGAGVASAKPARWNLTLESGTEYDSNVHRLERVADDDVTIEDSPLMRAGGRLRMSWRPSGRQRLFFDGWGGGKLFLEEAAQSENIGIVDGRAGYELGLPGRGAVIALRGDYYETFSANTAPFSDLLVLRNFASGNGETALTVLGPGSHRLTADVGYRAFRYKPDQDFDWHGEHYGLLYHTTIWRGDPDRDADASSVDVNVRYRLARRDYHGLAYRNKCPDSADVDLDCLVPTLDLDRADLHHHAAAEVVYTGERIWSAGYQLFVNDSNSFGQSYVRQRIDVGVTTETWGEVFLTAKAAVQLITFLDPLLLLRSDQSEMISIDDENRNSLSLHLARELSRHWSAEARYVLYTNEFASQELTYRRQTAYLGLVYNYR